MDNTANEPTSAKASPIGKAEALDRGTEFSNRGLYAVFFIAALALMFAFYHMIHEQNRRAGTPTDAVSFDPQIFGMRALLDLAGMVNLPVRPISSVASSRYINNGVVILPDVSRPETVKAARLRFSRARAIVFMLPKRIPTNPMRRFRRNAPVHRISPVGPIERVLAEIAPNASLVRPSGTKSWANTAFNEVPAINDAQLVSGANLMPVVSRTEGAMIARLATRGAGPAIYIVADPDPFLNHGLDDGNNAEFAVAFLETLRGANGRVLIDDTAAGAIDPPSFWRELFRPPLAALTITSLALIGLVFLAAFARFGASARPRANVGCGRGTILEASVSLLSRRAHAGTALENYWHQTLRAVAQRFRAPNRRDHSDIISFLYNIETDRRVTHRAQDIESQCRTIDAKAPEHQTAALAHAIHTWRTEMLSGRHRNSTT